MKKIFSIIAIFMSIFYIGNVKAASAKLTISPTSKTYIAGNTFTVTVSISASDPISALSYTIQYNSGVLELQSTSASTGGARNLDVFMNNNTSSASYTYTFKAKSEGSTTISVTGLEVKDKDNGDMSVSAGTASITVKTQAQVYASYSGNNYLSNLGVEGYDLEPGFSRDNMEYSVKLKPETEKIVVSGSREENTSSVNGLGEIAVSEGMNQIKIDVVAQNGNVRTYIINAEVTEYDPISEKIDGVDYTVVRSKKAQTFNNNLFTETTINISDAEIPAFYNETNNITVVALKNAEGEISYFVYDNGTFTKFNELKLNGIDLIIKKATNVPDGYNITNIFINDISYDAYKKKDTSRFALVYGTNLTNNNEGFYVYDNYENTLQRYDEDLTKDLVNELQESSKYVKLTYILGGTSIGLLVLLFISLLVKPKKNKEIKVEEKKVENKLEVEDIKKIEEDINVEPKEEKKEKAKEKKNSKKKK